MTRSDPDLLIDQYFLSAEQQTGGPMTQKINPKDLLELISKAHKEEIAGYVAGVGAGLFFLYASEKN